jgi:lipopolysaccharide biosynthesis glycosyltransferase
MTSILENSFSHTYYVFYLLVDRQTFKNDNKRKLKNLEKKYDRCEVNILEISNEIIPNANVKRYPFAAYYRLLLADLVPEFNRIIYLDGDTLIYDDLTEMLNLDMENNIMLGFVDNSYHLAEEFGIVTYKYIVSGVLLINLKKIRKENITQQFFDFIDKYHDKLSQEDQTVINIVLYGRIGFLPPKFGIWNFIDKNAVLDHNSYKNRHLGIKAYKESEILKAWNLPSIIHFVRSKPWKAKTKHTHILFHEDWWKYAKMTDEYKNILSNYGNFV